MAANDGQLKLKFLMYKRFFNAITGNGINIFDGGGEFKVTRAVPDKHYKFFWLNIMVFQSVICFFCFIYVAIIKMIHSTDAYFWKTTSISE